MENQKYQTDVYLPEIIGKNYGEFWRSKKRYVVCKGSRASKKSTTAALKIIYNMMKYPLANCLVVRKTAATLKDSCYAQLQWAINRLKVAHLWRGTVNPLQLTYLPTGQKILFRGCDDSLKITSITVEQGVLCWGLVEEAYEIEEDDFKRVDESLRGQLPPGYFIQWLIVFNPWSSTSWLKARFFDMPNDNVLAMTTTYKMNEWLSADDLAMFEDMKITDPERYKVAGEGDWGLEGGRYFNEWRESLHVVKPFEIPKNWIRFRAMDFGISKPYACLWFAVDYDNNLYCYRELYGWGGKANVGTGETAKQIAEKIVQLETHEEHVNYGVLDSACWQRTGVSGPSIEEELNNVLIKNRLVSFSKSSKGRLEGANQFKQRLIGNKLKDGTYKPAIYFFSNCIHSIRTIPMIGHDKHDPELPDTNCEDHCFVADTMISTRSGDIPIEQVTTDDYVLTRKGYRKVLLSAMTRQNTNVMTVEFSNGAKLTGTGNHPIYIKGKGFTQLDTVNYGDIIYGVSEVYDKCQNKEKKKLKQSCSMELPLGVIQIPKDCQTVDIIEQTADLESKESPIYTVKCGNSITEKFPKVTTSTTSTETLSTMTFPILNLSKETSTCLSTSSTINNERNITSGVLNIWQKSEKRQQNGINQKRGANGIDNTVSNVQKNKPLKKSKRNVSSAVKNIMSESSTAQEVSIAQMRVVQNTEEPTELMTKQGSVQFVAKNIKQTDSQNKKLAAENVVFAVCCYIETKKADVYNLTVDEVHEYFANGILVHNCYDATAYGCMSRPFSPTRPKPQEIRDAWADDKFKRSAWTY